MPFFRYRCPFCGWPIRTATAYNEHVRGCKGPVDARREVNR